MKKRSRNLRDEDIERIVRLLDTWTGPLSWRLLIDAIAERLGCRYSRQALHNRTRIQLAFSHARGHVQHRTSAPSTQRQIELARLEVEKARSARLRRENDALLQQFVVWQYNALAHGMTEKELNRPLRRSERAGRRRIGPVMTDSGPRGTTR